MKHVEAPHDVLVAGAGPAGSSIAIRLAAAGLRVILIEQKRFPRAKLCGEFISPECLPHFADLGVIDKLQTNAVSIDRTVFYARDGKSVVVPSEWFSTGSPAMGLSRAEMDARLLDRARDLGIEVREESHVSGLLTAKDTVRGVRIRNGLGKPIELGSGLVVDATGRTRALAREIDRSHGQPARRASFVAFKAHLQNADVNAADCEIYAYRGGYGGCSHVENGLSNLCFIVSADLAKAFGSDATELMRKVVFTNRRAASAMKNASVVGEWLAVPIENYGRTDLAPAEGLLTVGDAAGFIDPFTGSGILLALESSKVLAEVIAKRRSGTFALLAADYEQRYRAIFNRRLRISAMVRRVAFVPFLAETVIRILSLSNGLTRCLARATRPRLPARDV